MYNVKRINKSEEEALGAVADQLSYNIPKGIITNKLRFVIRALQNGATKPTVQDFLNQLADEITISVGNTKILKFDPIDYYEYMIRKGIFNGIGIIHDGTGGDNQVMRFVFDLPLCPLDKYVTDLMNKDYGFNGQLDVNVLVEYPADANELDGRTIDIYAIGMNGSNPSKIIEYEKNNITFSTTGDDQKIGLSQKSTKKLYDLFIEQTSYLSEGQTTEELTVQAISYQEENEDAELFDIKLSHIARMPLSASETTGVMLHDDQYDIIPFHEAEDAETSKQLTNSSQLAVSVGVAEAFYWTQIRIAPLSIYS